MPAFPTNTIGSFPQTAAIRQARAAYKRSEIGHLDYLEQMRAEIRIVVEKQEQLGLDVLVHGEAERNDMVEYFGEKLWGYAFTANGWVQSYGSRCVKPPFNDIGPGVYDIHSPRIPRVDDMERLLRKAREVTPNARLWVNPDCGLKTRNWPETCEALGNMVQAAHNLRATRKTEQEDLAA